MRSTLLLAAALAAVAGCESAPDASYADATETMEAVSMEPTAELADRDAVALASAPTAATASEALADRRLRRTADLHVRTDDHETTVREARALASRFGGFIAGEDGRTAAHIAETVLTLRIPSDRFEDAVDALAALGDVERRSVTVDDVTRQSVDLDARLRAKRAAEARYVALLRQTDAVEEILTVQNRLDGVRAEIEAMASQARALEGSVALSTVRATFVATPAVAPPAGPGFFARVADAVALGWHGVLAVLLGVLPLWPLAPPALVAAHLWRKRQRLTLAPS